MKLLARILTSLLGQRYGEGEPVPDMYLPNRLLAIAGILAAMGIGAGVVAVMTATPLYFIFAVLLFPLGIVAFLCWKNQSIRIITSTTFEHTTFLGNTHTYRFADITGLRKNSDSMTLFVGSKKIHIESMAILSERLVKEIVIALEPITDQ